MSRVLEATADANGKVYVNQIEVTDVEILSEGKQASTGILIIDEDKKYYVVNGVADLIATIEKLETMLDTLVNSLTKIATTFTAIGSGMTGPTTAPPGTLAADVAEIVTRSTELTAVKGELTTLKGALK